MLHLRTSSNSICKHYPPRLSLSDQPVRRSRFIQGNCPSYSTGCFDSGNQTYAVLIISTLLISPRSVYGSQTSLYHFYIVLFCKNSAVSCDFRCAERFPPVYLSIHPPQC